MNKVGYVYSTTNYEIFKKLEGNREVFEQRKRNIVRSIHENGWIRNPIVVNEKMEVIDGQGRLEALKELQMPVEYVISEGADISTCIALNVKQNNWKTKDYVECYAGIGNTQYIKLKELMEEYGLDLEITIIIAGKGISDCGVRAAAKNGIFKIEGEQDLHKRMLFAKEVLKCVGRSNGRLRVWAGVIKTIYYCDAIDNKIFLEKMKKYKNFIEPCVNVKQVLECLEKIYNYHSSKEKVYFIPEYEKQIRK